MWDPTKNVNKISNAALCVIFYLQFKSVFSLLMDSVPLATEAGISLIILTPIKTQMVATSSTYYDVVTFLTQ
jgi:hypothetical protein